MHLKDIDSRVWAKHFSLDILAISVEIWDANCS